MSSSYIVAARRTPIGKLLGSLSGIPAPQLAAAAIRAALGDAVLPRPRHGRVAMNDRAIRADALPGVHPPRQHVDVVAALAQCADEPRSDQPRSARHKHPHEQASRFVQPYL